MHCDLTFSPDLRIHSDPLRLQQIVTNLIGNAIKFTAVGRVRLLGETYTNSLGDWLKLSVQDTGIGLQADQIERLFIPFQQADDSHARRYGGTGLGLTITRHLVQLFGGTITVDSAPDQGALFVVNLPIQVDASQPMLDATQEVAGTAPDTHQEIQCPGLKVLVVEDHPVNQTIISTILRNMQCEVQLAANGLQALERIQSQAFDLVLMDCQMPEMDGFEAVTLLRQREAQDDQMPRLPVIALTALAMKGDADRCRACGMDDYLSKPINRGLLEEKIAFWAKTVRQVPNTATAPPATAPT
jgi:CheY-like chemotaxis protein